MDCPVKAFWKPWIAVFYVSYDTELKKNIFLWVSPQDLFELLTAVMKVIPEVFSTSVVTDDFVRMVYWICYQQMIYDLNRSDLSWIFVLL